MPPTLLLLIYRLSPKPESLEKHCIKGLRVQCGDTVSLMHNSLSRVYHPQFHYIRLTGTVSVRVASTQAMLTTYTLFTERCVRVDDG